MVTPLWKACSEGSLADVQELLNSASSVDIEVKDHTGVTPLIEATKNNHIEVVRLLLAKGADPFNGSSQGPPQHYTSDPVMLELINSAQAKITSSNPSYSSTYASQPPNKAYYPAPYGYYPPINTMNGQPVPDANGYYHPAPAPDANGVLSMPPGNLGSLPPPDIAKSIPCRYFPACRYGASCIFQHPTGPYFPGSVPPPVQYPQYDPQAFSPNYYPISPPFQPPPILPVSSPTSPPGHLRSASDLAPHFTGPTAAPPVPYAVPYGPVPVPVPVPVSGPDMQQPQFTPTHPTYVPPPEEKQVLTPVPPGQLNGIMPHSPQIEPEGDIRSHYRENGNVRRGGGPRRGSFLGRGKPPCLFYPAGRCKNGPDCRFAHVMPENGSEPPTFTPGRGGPRPRGGAVNGRIPGGLDAKLAGLNMRDDQARVPNGTAYRPHLDGRSRHTQGAKNMNPKKPVIKQRVPDANDFPVLSGSTTPPVRSLQLNGINGHSGPTAAQVLQAPAPIRRDSSKEIPITKAVKEHQKTLINDNTSSGSSPGASIPPTFASITNGTSSETPKEVSVSA